MKSLTRSLVLLASLATLAACPANIPGGGSMPGGGGGGLSRDACGDYAAKGGDAGRKIKAFLDAAVELDGRVTAVENSVKDACAVMAGELGIPAEGDTKTLCDAVAKELRASLQAGLKAEAAMKVTYKPAVCKVDASVAAKAAAECEGKAEADVAVKCEGTCSGTCQGACSGTCKAKNADGSCNGECQGTCQGSCSGGCDGHADVNASAECQASAEVKANLDVQCEPAQVEVAYDAKVVVDKARLDKAVSAIKKGLPQLLAAQKRAEIALQAVGTFAKTAKDLGSAAKDIASAFGDAAFCVAGQLSAAAAAVVNIQVKVEVSVEASASVGGACGASAG